MSDGAPTRRQRTSIDVANDRAARGDCPACGEPSKVVKKTRSPVVRVESDETGEELIYKCGGSFCGLTWSYRVRKSEAALARPRRAPRLIPDGERAQIAFLATRDDHVMLYKLADASESTLSDVLRDLVDREARAKGFRK